MKHLNYLFLTILILVVTFQACTTDYHIEDLKYSEPNRIGINALLNPQEDIQINIFQVQRSNKRYTASGLQGALVVLKEENVPVYQGVVIDSVLAVPHKPQAGKSYSIAVSYAGLETITAQTTVPEPVKCHVSMELVKDKWDLDNYLVKIKEVEMHEQSKASLWITAYETKTDGGCNNQDEI